MSNGPYFTPEPPVRTGGKLKYLLLALAPIPVALALTVVTFLSSGSNGDALTSLLGLVGTAAFVCCVIGAIGMCGGFDGGGRSLAVIGGIVLGIILFVAEAIITLGLGCAIVASHH